MNATEHYNKALELEEQALREFRDSDTTEPAPAWMLTIQQARMHAELAQVAVLSTALAPLVQNIRAVRN